MACLHVFHEAAEVAPAHVRLDDDAPLAPFALNRGGPGHLANRRELAERNSLAGGRCNGYGRRASADRSRYSLPSRTADRNGAPPRGPDQSAGADASTTSSTSRAGMPWRAIAARSTSTSSTGWPVTCSTVTSAAPAIWRTTASISRAFAFSTSRSSPKSLTPTSLRIAGDHLVDAHLDRLREDAMRMPGQDRPSSVSIIALTSSSCVRARVPALARCQRDEHVRELEPHRIGGDLRRAGAGPDALDLVGELREEHLLDLRAVAHRLVERTPRRGAPC